MLKTSLLKNSLVDEGIQTFLKGIGPKVNDKSSNSAADQLFNHYASGSFLSFFVHSYLF